MSSGLLSACLFLLLDASGSVDAKEHALQREATAAALTSPEFLARVEYEGGIAVAVAEFSTNVTVIADWTTIRNSTAASVLADAIVAAGRVESGSTAVGDAVVAAVASFDRSPACERRVIDISTDGRANAGSLVEDAVGIARQRSVMVNALVIEEPTEPGLLDYYRDAVNGFALPATWDTYAQSLKMKMTLEIANAPRVLENQPLVAYTPPYAQFRGPQRAHGYAIEDATTGAVYVDYAPRRYLDLSHDIRRRPDVPAPGSLGLIVAGLVIVAGAAWRRR